MFQRALEGSTDVNDERMLDTLEPAFTPTFLAQLDQLLQKQLETSTGDSVWASLLLGQMHQSLTQHNLVVLASA